MNLRADTVISLSGIGFERDSRVILRDINLDIRRRDFVAITGPNGGGKTTLLRIILGLVKPTRGRVCRQPDMSVGYLPQKNMIDAHFPISVREVVESGLLNVKDISRDERADRVAGAIALVELDEHASRPIGLLSGGQLQRALLARAVISRPSVLVLDEPLSYIDKKFEEHLYRIIADIARTTTILLVSHEMTEISTMATRHLIVDVGLHECCAAHHYFHSDCK